MSNFEEPEHPEAEAKQGGQGVCPCSWTAGQGAIPREEDGWASASDQDVGHCRAETPGIKPFSNLSLPLWEGARTGWF